MGRDHRRRGGARCDRRHAGGLAAATRDRAAGGPHLRSPPRPVRPPCHRGRLSPRREIGPGLGPDARRRGVQARVDGPRRERGQEGGRRRSIRPDRAREGAEGRKVRSRQRRGEDREGAYGDRRAPAGPRSYGEALRRRAREDPQIPEQGHAHLLAQSDHRVAGRRAALHRPKEPRRADADARAVVVEDEARSSRARAE